MPEIKKALEDLQAKVDKLNNAVEAFGFKVEYSVGDDAFGYALAVGEEMFKLAWKLRGNPDLMTELLDRR